APVEALMSFTTMPAGSGMRESIASRIATLQRAAISDVYGLLAAHQRLDVHFSLAAPSIIIPQTVTDAASPAFVVTLGTLLIDSADPLRELIASNSVASTSVPAAYVGLPLASPARVPSMPAPCTHAPVPAAAAAHDGDRLAPAADAVVSARQYDHWQLKLVGTRVHFTPKLCVYAGHAQPASIVRNDTATPRGRSVSPVTPGRSSPVAFSSSAPGMGRALLATSWQIDGDSEQLLLPVSFSVEAQTCILPTSVAPTRARLAVTLPELVLRIPPASVPLAASVMMTYAAAAERAAAEVARLEAAFSAVLQANAESSDPDLAPTSFEAPIKGVFDSEQGRSETASGERSSSSSAPAAPLAATSAVTDEVLVVNLMIARIQGILPQVPSHHMSAGCGDLTFELERVTATLRVHSGGVEFSAALHAADVAHVSRPSGDDATLAADTRAVEQTTLLMTSGGVHTALPSAVDIAEAPSFLKPLIRVSAALNLRRPTSDTPNVTASVSASSLHVQYHPFIVAAAQSHVSSMLQAFWVASTVGSPPQPTISGASSATVHPPSLPLPP
ncbi:MAG: hypothetical protein EOO65_04095, partial [Methanosarcinales archaeon]